LGLISEISILGLAAVVTPMSCYWSKAFKNHVSIVFYARYSGFEAEPTVSYFRFKQLSRNLATHAACALG
jgi:hypothetical protein